MPTDQKTPSTLASISAEYSASRAPLDAAYAHAQWTLYAGLLDLHYALTDEHEANLSLLDPANVDAIANLKAARQAAHEAMIEKHLTERRELTDEYTSTRDTMFADYSKRLAAQFDSYQASLCRKED